MESQAKKLYNNKQSAKLRRQRVIVYLENQLVRKTKQNDGVIIPLIEEDISRINKELKTLKTRI